jgi:uncharacterized protein (TIGR00288 family)
MNTPPPDSNATMAVFLDLENIALGARDAQFPEFDIRKVLERLLLKGHIVVKKAYCDFGRYKDFKRSLHEAAFELIEIPHVRQSGKNSADIRMVVDALDLCYTKSHLDTFVIISGDSDFSPLVSKLRENAKKVIGVGVKNSTSDLFINNCDEFIYYDDLARAAAEKRPAKARVSQALRPAPGNGGLSPTPAPSAPDDPKKPAEKPRAPSVAGALTFLTETLDAMRSERDDEEGLWAGEVKLAMKRRNPGFNERAHGFASFSAMLEEAAKRGLLKLDPKTSGTYRVRPAE